MVATKPSTPIARVGRKAIGPTTTIALFAMAAGRCQFNGCNRLLIEHHVTKKLGNYGEKAHIVAYETAGPRGRTKRPDYIHDLQNLMLLCPACHKHVDDNPDEYPVAALRSYKQAHEERARRLTGLDKNHETKVVIVKARIGGDVVAISTGNVIEAIAPYYPDDSHFFEIDLTQLSVSDETFFDAAQQTIRNRVERLIGNGAPPQRISLFAIAPIPTLMFLGNILSNKLSVELFQRHRDTSDWKWKHDSPVVEYVLEQLQEGIDPPKVALVLSLSGQIDRATLPSSIDSQFSVYEVRLHSQQPTPDFLRTLADLNAFRAFYRSVMARIRAQHGMVAQISVFPAVPAPLAIACGHDLLPKVDPALKVYDYDKQNGGFVYTLMVNENRHL